MANNAKSRVRSVVKKASGKGSAASDPGPRKAGNGKAGQSKGNVASPAMAGTAIPTAASWQPRPGAPLHGDPHPSSSAAGPSNVGTLPAADKTVSTVLGEITWLLTQSPQHKQLAIADLEWMVMPALLLRQFKLFYDAERNIPVGVVLFAKVSDAVAARLDAGGRLATLDDWRSGAIVRVMTTIAPFGGDVRL
jgi:cytolysin-activating lysine-acyltransferase